MILLDDALSSASKPSSRLYQDPINHWQVLQGCDRANTNASITRCLEDISAALARGEYVVATFAYELGYYFHELEPRKSNQPLLEAWTFQSYTALSKDEVDRLIAGKLDLLDLDTRSAGVLDLSSSISAEQFCEDIERIQEYIRSGDTYQINHTFNITGKAYGSPLGLYALLRKRQPGRFGAYIAQGTQHILSQSPELLIQRQGNVVTAMPMKGTASAIEHSALELGQDPKNRAENLMIVDLLRNDLGRVALTGSVKTPSLFEVARHGDVLQMTSTVQAQVESNTKFVDILRAVFPCGSITGAPKKRSMEIIQGLETLNRHYYCGALGWLDPNGDFALSVPIRTIELTQDPNTLTSEITLGVGAGITIDSVAKQEWEECRIKSAFLNDLPSAVGLFETILIKDGLAQSLESHLSRIQHSAIALNIPFDLMRARILIEQCCNDVNRDILHRLRLDLSNHGELTCVTAPVDPIAKQVKIFWANELLQDAAKTTMRSGNPLLGHKTTQRSIYDAGWQAANAAGGFDAIFTNEQGLVTEGGRSSIFIQKQGSNDWLTPPLSAGVLPGVMRARILADPQWNAHEANLTIRDVIDAKAIMLSNALRGTIAAHL